MEDVQPNRVVKMRQFDTYSLGSLGEYFESWDMDANDGYGELLFEGCIVWPSSDSTSFEVAEAVVYGGREND